MKIRVVKILKEKYIVQYRMWFMWFTYQVPEDVDLGSWSDMVDKEFSTLESAMSFILKVKEERLRDKESKRTVVYSREV